MIVCTKSAQLFMRKSFDSDSVLSTSFQDAIASFAVDPTLNIPPQDIFIITTDDVKGRRQIAEFTSAAANKHPNVKILYVSKKAKGDPIQQGLPGIDGYLVNPKTDQIKNEVARIIQTDSISAVAAIQEREYENVYGQNGGVPDMSMGNDETDVDQMMGQMAGAGNDEEVYQEVDDTADAIPDFDDSEFYNQEAYEQPEEEEVAPTEPVQDLEVPDMNEPAPAVEEDVNSDIESELLKRINNSRKVADIDAYMHEATATVLIKDMIASNSTYAAIEERLKSLNNAIFEIMNNNRDYKSLTEKLSTVRALLHDRAFMSAKGDTLLEQRLEEVIDTVLSRTSELLNDKLAEIEQGIKTIKDNKNLDAGNGRLGGLNQQRVNIILELTQLQAEINNIYKNTDELCTGVLVKMSERSVDLTGDPEMNTRIKAQGSTLVSDETLTALRAISDYASDRLPMQFKEMLRSVVVMTRLYNELLETDREIIANQQAAIEYLKSKNVEDSIVAKTLLKKSLRVFIAEEGTGRTIIPYLLSAHKSRQNANVLLFDITGTGKYDSYNILVNTPESFMANQFQNELCIVSGEIPNSVAAAQRVITALNKAADYYRVINVVMRPDQKELFDTFIDDVLSVNYIVEPTPKCMEMTKQLIKETTTDNVARRVIFNRCNIPIGPMTSLLGLDDDGDIQFCVIPSINEITDASIRCYNPYGISSVSILMEDVSKYA